MQQSASTLTCIDAEALQFGALVASGMSASMQMVVLAPISSNVQWEARERRSRTTSVLKFLTLSMRVSSLSRCSSLWLNAGARVHLRVRMHDWRRPPSEFRTGADEPRYAKRVRQIEQRVDGRGHLEILFRRSGGASCGVVVVGPVAPRTCFITRRSYTPSHARVGKKSL